MKKQKGMTLMEIVISMAIYSILALLVAEIMTSMNTLMRVTDQLNDRLAYEAKFADNNQTVNESGSPFGSKTISYTVSYDGTLVGESTPSRGYRSVMEYTMGYDDSRVDGSTHVADVNYRFMSFDRVARDPAECPDGPFVVYLRVVPYYSDEVPATLPEQKAAINKAKNLLSELGEMTLSIDTGSAFDGMAGTVYTPIDLKAIGLGGQLAIDLDNKSRSIDDTINNVSTTFSYSVNRTHDGLTDRWAFGDAQVFMYVKVGASDTAETYYKACIVEFAVDDTVVSGVAKGGLKAMPSLTLSEFEHLPPTTDYEAILAS